MDDLYDPDGRPVKLRTTAAEFALRAWEQSPGQHRAYRDAAAYEGERYAEAIREANASRHATFVRSNRNLAYVDCAFPGELTFGTPTYWLTNGGRA